MAHHIPHLGTGASVPANPSAQTPSATAAATPYLLARVLGFGDSTMVGIDGNTLAQVPPAQRALNIFAASRGLPAFNAGIPGTVLQDTLDANGSPRPGNGFGRYRADTLGASASQVVVCNYGLNDLRWVRHNLSTFIARYTTIVTDWKAAGIEVILASPGWIPDAGYAEAQTNDFKGSNRAIHEAVVAAVWQLAKSEGVKYAPVYERMKAAGPATVGNDKVHPSAVPGYSTAGQAMIDAAVPNEARWPGSADSPADAIAPVLVSAVVPDAARNTIVFTYSEPLDPGSVPAAWAYAPSGGRTPVSVGISGPTVTLTVSGAYAPSDAVTCSYVPGASPLRDLAGNPAAALSARVVTNNASGTSGTSDADVDAWLMRVAQAGGTVTGPQQAAVRNFVASAKGSGYFGKFRRLNLFVGDEPASLVPLVNTSGAALDANTGTTYAPASGRQSNGTNQFVNTGHVPTHATGGLSIYLRTAQTSNTTQRVPIGCRNAASSQAFRLTANSSSNGTPTAGGVAGVWGGTAPGPFAATSGGMTAGLWQITRTSRTSLALYRNGAQVGSATADITPVSPTVPVCVFAQNGGGTAGAFVEANTQIGAYGIDSGMTAAEAAAYWTHLQALMTALGRNV